MIKKKFPDGSDTSGAVVVTHSSGNHGQAVSLAAKQCGIPAQVVMPKNTPAVKIAAVMDYGGSIVLCENTEQVLGFIVGNLRRMCVSVCVCVCVESTVVCVHV